MIFIKRLMIFAVVLVMALCLTSCTKTKKTLPERASDAVKSAGETIEEAADDAGDAIDDAAKK